MRITIDHLEEMFTTKTTLSYYVRVLSEYSKLKPKVEDPESQSWYFQRGLESQIKRLARLKYTFNDFVDMYNNNTIDDFLAAIAKRALRIAEYEQRERMNWITRSFFHSLKYRTAFEKSLIHLKSKMDSMYYIDHYLEHPEDMMPLLD